MSIGDGIALAALILGALGAVLGFVYWTGQKDAKAQQSIDATSELKTAVVGLTVALNGTTTELRELKAEMKTRLQAVDDSHEAIWEEIGKLRDRG